MFWVSSFTMKANTNRKLTTHFHWIFYSFFSQIQILGQKIKLSLLVKYILHSQTSGSLVIIINVMVIEKSAMAWQYIEMNNRGGYRTVNVHYIYIYNNTIWIRKIWIVLNFSLKFFGILNENQRWLALFFSLCWTNICLTKWNIKWHWGWKVA